MNCQFSGMYIRPPFQSISGENIHQALSHVSLITILVLKVSTSGAVSLAVCIVLRGELTEPNETQPLYSKTVHFIDHTHKIKHLTLTRGEVLLCSLMMLNKNQKEHTTALLI